MAMPWIVNATSGPATPGQTHLIFRSSDFRFFLNSIPISTLLTQSSRSVYHDMLADAGAEVLFHSSLTAVDIAGKKKPPIDGSRLSEW